MTLHMCDLDDNLGCWSYSSTLLERKPISSHCAVFQDTLETLVLETQPHPALFMRAGPST